MPGSVAHELSALPGTEGVFHDQHPGAAGIRRTRFKEACGCWQERRLTREAASARALRCACPLFSVVWISKGLAETFCLFHALETGRPTNGTGGFFPVSRSPPSAFADFGCHR